MPGRHSASGGVDRTDGARCAAWVARPGDRAARRYCRGRARRLDLRPRPDSYRRGDLSRAPRPNRCERKGIKLSTPVFLASPQRLVDVTIDGKEVRVPEGATVLEACRQQGIDTPTLCYLENLTPVNV